MHETCFPHLCGYQIRQFRLSFNRTPNCLLFPAPPPAVSPLVAGEPRGGRKRQLPLGFVRAAAYRTRPWVVDHRAASGIPSVHGARGGGRAGPGRGHSIHRAHLLRVYR